ncbi:putative membrane protein [Kitasatospora sp. MAP12-15]|uniref:histidine kinase n=1 Tax=unclassified Kitasatospora TaxID=2633591 RepID=UPI002474C700|nr:histidine kinase [Kitasatospora sp. MAP12-44]MDH6108966.1 putative membrane protein [Kitasatospora sp. MAP12-44]
MPESHTMLFVTFRDQASVRAAYEEVKELHGVRQAAVLERSADGLLDVPESWVRGAGATTVAGGLVGGLVGLIGGPIGVFLGWTAGTMLGGAAEIQHFQDAAEGLMVYSRGLTEGGSLLIAELREHSPDAVDAIALRHGGTVVRRPAEEVAAEVQAAQTAAEEAVRSEQQGDV